jgi:hypothetical protein
MALVGVAQGKEGAVELARTLLARDGIDVNAQTVPSLEEGAENGPPLAIVAAAVGQPGATDLIKRLVSLGAETPLEDAALQAVVDKYAVASSRLLDFLHSATLPPLRGCFNDASNPLVGLDEALARQPDDLAAEVWSAKQWVRAAATREAIGRVPGLTDDGAMAIWLYTAESPLYRGLNAKLRAANRGQVTRLYFPFMRLLLTALRAVQAASGGEKLMVNRGVPSDVCADFPGDYTEESSIVWWAFSSCTRKIAVLSNPMFLGSAGERTIFQVLTRHAIDVSPFSAVQSEAEVLLPAGIVLRVTGVLPKDASGLTIITCEDDDSAPALIS